MIQDWFWIKELYLHQGKEDKRSFSKVQSVFKPVIILSGYFTQYVIECCPRESLIETYIIDDQSFLCSAIA